MSANSNNKATLSLAQHFEAPDHYLGEFAWLCGYSADSAFLNDAAERFTRCTNAVRASEGRIVMALMLDPSAPVVPLSAAPGVAHLLLKDSLPTKPFRLLHAKVALLGFRHQDDARVWQMRLLVSTGNWTRQTLESSLDLMWRIDVDHDSLNVPTQAVQRDCADVQAAWDLMQWLQAFFDTRLLTVSGANTGRLQLGLSVRAQENFANWIQACRAQAQGAPRFFDNRSQSLLAQLPAKIKVDGASTRNYLAMGSGFYESVSDPQQAPAVPMEILSTLKAHRLLSSQPVVDLYVNPQACQGVATAWAALNEAGVYIRAAESPEAIFGSQPQRSLHAKFLFSTTNRDSKNKEKSLTCSAAWIYLGSGNLTHPGFAHAMSAEGGNLEAGVVFAPGILWWSYPVPGHADEDRPAVNRLLPLQWDSEVEDAASLSTGAGMPEDRDHHVAPPIAWFDYAGEGQVGELRTEEDTSGLEVLDALGTVCPSTSSGFHWLGDAPREVTLRRMDDPGVAWRVPVVDALGRIGGTPLPSLDLDEVCWILDAFPTQPADDEVSLEEGAVESATAHDHDRSVAGSTVASYPIRQMMAMVESIAAKQTTIGEADWERWCQRLHQTLKQASASLVVSYFRDQLVLNPLSPLRHPEFRPEFALNNTTRFGQLYEEILDQVARDWNVDALIPIGGAA